MIYCKSIYIFLARMDYTMPILREPLTHWNPLGSTGKYRRERPVASETYFGSSVHSPQKTILFQ